MFNLKLDGEKIDKRLIENIFNKTKLEIPKAKPEDDEEATS
jgi:hypothetical protein